jgi:hypothetical protein
MLATLALAGWQLRSVPVGRIFRVAQIVSTVKDQSPELTSLLNALPPAIRDVFATANQLRASAANR